MPVSNWPVPEYPSQAGNGQRGEETRTLQSKATVSGAVSADSRDQLQYTNGPSMGRGFPSVNVAKQSFHVNNQETAEKGCLVLDTYPSANRDTDSTLSMGIFSSRPLVWEDR